MKTESKKEKKARLEKEAFDRAVRLFVDREFDMIPGVLFERLAQLTSDFDSVLTPVVGDNTSRECPECGAEIDFDTVKVDPDDDDTKHWECDSCDASDESTLTAWEDLAPAGPRYGAWPAAHGVVFWTTNAQAAQLAPSCGFLVYESPDFNGYILGVDGGGYDFYGAHWAPLYRALGYRWHETE